MTRDEALIALGQGKRIASHSLGYSWLMENGRLMLCGDSRLVCERLPMNDDGWYIVDETYTQPSNPHDIGAGVRVEAPKHHCHGCDHETRICRLEYFHGGYPKAYDYRRDGV